MHTGQRNKKGEHTGDATLDTRNTTGENTDEERRGCNTGQKELKGGSHSSRTKGCNTGQKEQKGGELTQIKNGGNATLGRRNKKEVLTDEERRGCNTGQKKQKGGAHR